MNKIIFNKKIDIGAKNLIKKILVIDPKKRLTIDDIINDEYFINKEKQLNLIELL